MDKPIELVKRNCYWPRMTNWITDSVRFCHSCRHNISVRHKKYRLLQPLKTPYTRWVSVSTDYIVQPPEYRGDTQICIVMYRFIKIAHSIPLKERATATVIAKAFLDKVWKFHALQRK